MGHPLHLLDRCRPERMRELRTPQGPGSTRDVTSQVPEHVAHADRPDMLLRERAADAPGDRGQGAADRLLDEQRAARERARDLQLEVRARRVRPARERGHAEHDQSAGGGVSG